MQLTRIFFLLFIVGLIITTVLSDLTSPDMDDNDDYHAVSKRIFGHKHHHQQRHGHPMQSGHCVRCKFSLARCCAPNICVKRRFRTDKCLRVKG